MKEPAIQQHVAGKPFVAQQYSARKLRINDGPPLPGDAAGPKRAASLWA